MIRTAVLRYTIIDFDARDYAHVSQIIPLDFLDQVLELIERRKDMIFLGAQNNFETISSPLTWAVGEDGKVVNNQSIYGYLHPACIARGII